MDKTKHPGISFDNIILKDITFNRKPDLIENPQLNLDFSTSTSFSEDKRKVNVGLTCIIKEQSEMFLIECTMIGMFSVIKGLENLNLEQFSKINAPALIFPYIRELITITTAKAGLAPIILPPINLYALLSKNSK